MFKGFERRTVQTTEAAIHCVTGGRGAPILLLHGYPQTHAIWHRLAPRLAQHFRVVAADLRGYGDSSKPRGTDDHANYAKRAMARDQVEVMHALGHGEFHVVGHDRGARVGHRMALDFPECVRGLVVLDAVPTRTMYARVDREFATAYYHWFFLVRPAPFPETLIGANPEFYLRSHLSGRYVGSSPFPDQVLAEYIRCFSDPTAIHGSCEDYRAGASIDLVHDEADLANRIRCPVLALWGRHGTIHRCFTPLADWRERAENVRGGPLDCGHYLPEEAPEEVLRELLRFLEEHPGIVLGAAPPAATPTSGSSSFK
jgi:haloacetate dehalogenase